MSTINFKNNVVNHVVRLSSRYLIFFIIAGIAYYLSKAILSENYTHIFVVAFALLFIFAVRFWRVSFFLAIVWLITGGALRKWVFPGYEKVFFFAPYIILSAVYLRFIGQRVISEKTIIGHTGINLIISFFLLWGVFEAFNPNLPEFVVGIIGLVIYFYFVPLLFITRYIFKDRQSILRFFKAFAVSAVPLLLLSIMQYFSPPDSPINTYVRTTESSIATAGQFVRVTSTFSYISGYTQYLEVLIMVIAYLLTIKGLSKRFVLFLYGLLPFTLVSLFMTGSRGPVAFSIIFILVYLTLVFTRNQGRRKRNVMHLISALLVGIVLISSTFIGKESYSSFSERASESSDIIPRIILTYTAPFRFFDKAGIVGFGIGSTYQGVQEQFGVGSMWRKMGIGFEEEPGRIMLELGLIGFIMAYYIRFAIVRRFWILSKKTNRIDLKNLAIAVFIFLFPFFIGINVLAFNQIANFFYWFFSGFLLAISDIDKNETTTGYNLSPR